MEKEKKVIEMIQSARSVLVLAGAGLSADSGIPTFRGSDGFWTVGSKNYFPEELATYRAFRKTPEIVWDWYRSRIKKYRECEPNPGHIGLVELENYCEEHDKNFHLITQNVDGLNRVAGSKNLIEIHGNLSFMRCSNWDCERSVTPVPMDFESEDIPRCEKCGDLMRPHVLWFDETYNEELFRSETAISLSLRSNLLFVVGTTLMTGMPYSIVSVAKWNDKPIVEINPQPVLGKAADVVFMESSSHVLPRITRLLRKGV